MMHYGIMSYAYVRGWMLRVRRRAVFLVPSPGALSSPDAREAARAVLEAMLDLLRGKPFKLHVMLDSRG